MPSLSTLPSVNLNALSKLISNAGLQRVMDDAGAKGFGRQLKKLLVQNGVSLKGKIRIGELISMGYEELLCRYRHEYIYKSAILNSYVLAEHSLDETLVLNEFKVGSSKADVVVVNGTDKVFEIKTELDSPERLESQVNDYFKAFSEVYLVVHHSMVEKYIGRVDKHVGIMVFSRNNALEVVYPATRDISRLDATTMLKSLRKSEYLTLIENLHGSVPVSKAVHLFAACCALAASYPVSKVQEEFLKLIKKRICRQSNKITLEEAIPSYLKFSCYHADLDENGYLALTKRLAHFI